MSLKIYSIVALHPNAIDFVVKGAIIGKSNKSIFSEKNAKNAQQTHEPALRGVVKFLIRDSNEHCINVTVWGSDEFIGQYDQKFAIGHVVNIVNSKLSSVRYEDIYNPITTSPWQLTINEGIGLIEFSDGDVTKFVKLLNIPLKSPDLALNLADIATTRPTSDKGDLVDLVVVVAKLKPTRQSKNKNIRDVIVVDQTVPGMHLTLWNEAWINR